MALQASPSRIAQQRLRTLTGDSWATLSNEFVSRPATGDRLIEASELLADLGIESSGTNGDARELRVPRSAAEAINALDMSSVKTLGR